jgi:hypothetical protein
MNLTIVSVCINYLDFLEDTYPRNKEAFNGLNYWIITDSKDTKTQDYCRDNQINCYITDVFYKGGCPFNKGAAINEFFVKSGKLNIDEAEWILLLDSDIVVRQTIQEINDMEKDPDCLYNCGRRIYNTKSDYAAGNHTIGGCQHIGYFQLFHVNKIIDYIKNQNGFLFEFRNSSYYDCEFSGRFKCQKCLPSTDVDHLGPIYLNWDGRISAKWG